MILSDDRKSHFAHLICDTLYDDDLVDFQDDGVALRGAKDGIDIFVDEFERIDSVARSKVQSLKRNVQEGTPEWETMYKKYYEEELKRSSNK